MLIPSHLLINFTIFANYFLNGIQNLQGPVTLIVHDESNHMISNIVAQSLVFSRSIVIFSVRKLPHHENPQKVGSVIVIGKDITEMVVHLRHSSLWSARRQVLVLTESKDHVKPWIEMLWRQTRAVQVTVMVMSNPPKYLTWFPYNHQECSEVMTIVTLNETNIFPSKIPKNINKCPMKVSFTELDPAVLDEEKGFESQIFQDLMHSINATPSVISLPAGNHIWRVLDRKGNPANGVKYLWDNKVDMIFSNMHLLYSVHSFVDFLTSHCEDMMSFFVPSPLPVSRATTLYRKFSPQIWSYILFTLLCIYCAITAIFFYVSPRNLSSAFPYTIGLSLNLPIGKSHIKSFGVLAMFSYIYSQHVTTWYQALLISSLTDIPRQAPIRTIEELAASKLNIVYYLTQDRVLSLFPGSTIAELTRLDRAVFTEALNLREVSENRNALLGPKISYAHYLAKYPFDDEFGYPLIQILKAPLYVVPMCFYVSKGHPLYEMLNKYTGRIIEAGLPGQYIKMFSNAAYPTTISKRKLKIEPLNLGNFLAAFQLLYLLLLVSCLIFAFEIVNRYCTDRRKLSKKLSHSHRVKKIYPNMQAVILSKRCYIIR